MENLRKYREKANLTQSRLAERLGVVEMTIRRWESGLREPRASDIKKLAEVLGVSDAELLNGPEKRRLEIIIDLEGDETMEAEAIKCNSTFVGYRKSDDSLIFRGAVPMGNASIEEIVEETVQAIEEELWAAFASRQALKK